MPTPRLPRSTARTLVAGAVTLVAALPLAACGGEDGPTDEEQVRERLTAFAQATARRDYQRLCDDLFSERLVEEVRRTVPCEVALRSSSLDQARSPKLEVRSVKVTGDAATAVVRTSAANQPASEDTVRLVREDGVWRIVALAS